MQSSKKQEKQAAETVEAAKEVTEEVQGGDATGHRITRSQFRAQLEAVDKTLRALPATAQVLQSSAQTSCACQ